MKFPKPKPCNFNLCKDDIKMLEFFNFLSEITNYLVTKKNTENELIINFIEAIENYHYYYWEKIQSQDYKQLVVDYVFWESREFYRRKVKEFAFCEIDGYEFVYPVLNKIYYDREVGAELIKNYEKQKTMKLNPKQFRFSKILVGLLLPLEGFNDEPDLDSSPFTEEYLREGIKLALIELEKYFEELN